MTDEIIHCDEEESPQYNVGDTVIFDSGPFPANGKQYIYGPGTITDRVFQAVNFGGDTWLWKWCYSVELDVQVEPPIRSDGQPDGRFQPSHKEHWCLWLYHEDLELELGPKPPKYSPAEIISRFVRA